jgi:putative ABC transport system permease protein
VNLQALDLGFDGERVMTARVGLFETDYPEESDRRQFYERLVDRLATKPGVVAAAVTSSLPTQNRDGTSYRLEGESYPTPRDVPGTNLAAVSPDFFEVFDIPLQRGRLLTAADRADAPPVVVVNRSFAERAWPGQDPIGKTLRFGRDDSADEPWRTVVGVVPDAWISNFNDPDHDGIYLPIAQTDRRFMSLAIRTAAADPTSATSALREAVLDLDRNLPIYWVLPMSRVVYEGSFFFNFFAVLFAVFGAAALGLAAVGIYGVMAHSVSQRTQEIGIRMALGASRRDVLAMVVRQGSVRLAIGLAIGLCLALAGSRFLAGILFDVEPADPLTLALTTLFLSVVTLVACLVPALRASRVPPTEALRYE